MYSQQLLDRIQALETYLTNFRQTHPVFKNRCKSMIEETKDLETKARLITLYKKNSSRQEECIKRMEALYENTKSLISFHSR